MTPMNTDVLMNEVAMRRRTDGWRITFEKVDRIVSGKRLTVTMVMDPDSRGMQDVPGWTDGETISLNGKMLIDEMASRTDLSRLVLAVKGVNYHELAHCLFSPRVTDDICKFVIERQRANHDHTWWVALNILEDQRAETWFTSTFTPSTKYFEALALRWLVSGKADVEVSHVLVHGRKFLPAMVRYKSRQAFVAKHSIQLAEQFADVIDEYLTVIFPADTQKALKLVTKFHGLMKKLSRPVDNMSGGHDPNSGNTLSQGKPNVGDQKRARDNARNIIEQAKQVMDQLGKSMPGKSEEEENQSGPMAGGGLGQGAPTTPFNGQEGESEAGTGNGAGNASGGATGVSQSDPDSQGAGGKGAGDAPGAFTPGNDNIDIDPMNEALNAMQDALDEVMDDADLQKDIADTQEAIRHNQSLGGIDAGGNFSGGNVQMAPDPARATAQRLNHVLSKMRSDLEPAWQRRQVTGRINMNRAMLRQPGQMDIFDRWDEGSEDEAGCEVVVCIDLSGSMSTSMIQASEALWALKRAFDDLNIRTTVLGYNHGHTVLMQGSEKAQRGKVKYFPAAGSTNPETAFNEALNILSRSDQPNKLLITITDGQWGDSARSEPVVEAMNRVGVTTMLLGLENAVQRYGKHRHQEAHDISNISELVGVATKMVAAILRNLRKRG